MVDKISYFELPNKNWFDSQGRIYKDALIENFNAIENKLLEIASLDAFKTEIPNVSTINYPDVTLDSPNNKIINLKSFLKITNIAGYPIECEFSGTTAKKIAYWTESGEYKILEDIDTNASSSNKYVYLDFVNGLVFSRNSANNPANSNLIGVYSNGIIKNVESFNYIGINALYYLARMSIDTYAYTFHSGTRDQYSSENGVAKSGRLIGAADTNTRTSGNNKVVFIDTGRTAR